MRRAVLSVLLLVTLVASAGELAILEPNAGAEVHLLSKAQKAYLTLPLAERVKKFGSSANRRKPQGSAATHPNTAGRFGAPRCRVGTPPLPRRLRRAA